MSRARVVAASPAFTDVLDALFREILCAPRDPDMLLRDVAAMRERIAKEHATTSHWQIKHWRGGLVDLEFMAQYLLLKHCGDHPDLITGNTADVFELLATKGLMASDLADRLSATTRPSPPRQPSRRAWPKSPAWKPSKTWTGSSRNAARTCATPLPA